MRVLEERDYSERTRSEVARGAWLLARALQHPDEPELFEQAREEALHEGYVLEWRILIEGKIAPEHIDDELLEDYLDERDDERAHAVVGFGAFQLGDFERAESEYLEAVDEGGEHWETWVGLGLTLLRTQGDPERALEALERAEDEGVSEPWEEDLEFLLEVARGRIERGAGDGLRPQPTPLRSRCS